MKQTAALTRISRLACILLLPLLLAGCPLEEPYPEPEPPGEVDEPEVDRSRSSRQEIIYDYATGQPVMIFHFEQIREKRPGELSSATTTLFIENVSSSQLTLTYQVEVWSDLGYYQWSTAGSVRNLPPGAGVDKGVVSSNPMDLKFARFVIGAR